MAQIALSEAIQNLRSELTLAMKAGAGEALQFQLGPIEMELEVAVEKESEGKGGIKWWIIEAGGGTRQTAGSTHKIKLTLEPKARGGGAVNVSDSDGGHPK
ncbi:MAG: trypco2 family protein [Burkholderiaceae bacterium]